MPVIGTMFRNLSSGEMANFIRSATESVCYAAPGIQTEVASAITVVAQRIGVEMISVSLDFDERVIRMGFGSIDGVNQLRGQGIAIQNCPGLRTGLVIVDQSGYVFTPTALYLENDSSLPNAPNAMRMSSEQLAEARARISPAAKAISIARAKTPDEKAKIEALPLDVMTQVVTEHEFRAVQQSLDKVPPVSFDVVRQVRVFEPYLQYVELSLTGAAIQRHRLAIPAGIQNLGASKELENRLRTTFDLIENDSKLSSKPLEEALNEIRKNFTPSLGKSHGRVVLKAVKPVLIERLGKFREKLVEYQKTVKAELQEQLNKSREDIINYFLPQVTEFPPDALRGQLLCATVNEEDARRWLGSELDHVFPKADDLIQEMKLEESFKDVTFETLNHYCPVVFKMKPLQASSDKGLRRNFDSGDLKSGCDSGLSPSYRSRIFSRMRRGHESWQDSFRTVVGVRSDQSLRALGRCLSGEQRGVGLFGVEPFHLPGLRTTDAPCGLARFDGLPECTAVEAVSRGHSRQRVALDLGRCGRAPRLPTVRGIGAAAHHRGTGAVWRRRHWPGVEGAGLCHGFDYHRSVPEPVSLGGLSPDQGGCQSPCHHRFARGNPGIRQHYLRQGARCAPARRHPFAARIDSGGRSGLSGFQASVHAASTVRWLRDSRQGQPALCLGVRTTGRRLDRIACRPNDTSGHAEVEDRLSATPAPSFVSRSRDGKAFGLSDQLGRASSTDHCRHLQKPVADRTLLQMAEAELGGEAFLRQLDQRRQGTNLDRRVHLPAGAHRHQASSPASVASDFSASHRNQYFRENHAGSISCERRAERMQTGHGQAIDSVMKSTGQ